MYLNKEVLRIIMNSMNTHRRQMDVKDVIGYEVWNKLKKIAKDECSECDSYFSDNEGDMLVDTNEKNSNGKSEIQLRCYGCGERVFIESDLFYNIVKDRELVYDYQIDGFIMKWNEKRKSERAKVEAAVASFNDFPQKENKNIKGEEENNNMMNSNKMFKGLDFGKANKDLYRLSHLGLAIKNAEGTFVSYDTANGQLVDVDLFDFDLDGMIYKMPVAHNQIQAGDVIVHNGSSVIVETKSSNGRIKVIDPVAGEGKEIMPTKNMFGFNFFTKILCLMDMNSLGASNDNPFGSMMPMMMMSAMSGEGKGSNDMMTMMMMSQMMSGNSQMGDMFSNPMMMMAMMSGDGKMSDMMPMMMMMQGGMFGQPVNKQEKTDMSESL